MAWIGRGVVMATIEVLEESIFEKKAERSFSKIVSTIAKAFVILYLSESIVFDLSNSCLAKSLDNGLSSLRSLSNIAFTKTEGRIIAIVSIFGFVVLNSETYF